LFCFFLYVDAVVYTNIPYAFFLFTAFLLVQCPYTVFLYLSTALMYASNCNHLATPELLRCFAAAVLLLLLLYTFFLSLHFFSAASVL
jgi:hypothetical protein